MKNKKILAGALILALIILGLAAYFQLRPVHQKVAQPKPSHTVNTVDYSGPSTSESTAGNEQKTANVDKVAAESSAANTGTGKTDATVFLVRASQYQDNVEIRGYVSNIFENGGTCTATLQKAGSITVASTSAAESSATTTQCGPINIPVAKFSSKGEWQLVLSYESPTARGSSASKTVTVQ